MKDYRSVEHVRIRISLAVRLVDDFTNRAVERNVIVRADNVPAPVRKTDGYYVFMNIQEKTVTLHVLSNEYEPCEETIDLSTLDPLQPVVKIRLRPGRGYPFPRGTTCIEGTAAPGRKMLAFCPEMTGYLRLLEDYNGGKDREVCLFHPSKTDLEGKSFCISVQDGKTEESFTIQSRAEEDRYFLRETMKNSYGKMTARIFPALKLTADESGKFFAPLAFFEKEHPRILIRTEGNGRKPGTETTMELEYGTVNTICLNE